MSQYGASSPPSTSLHAPLPTEKVPWRKVIVFKKKPSATENVVGCFLLKVPACETYLPCFSSELRTFEKATQTILPINHTCNLRCFNLLYTQRPGRNNDFPSKSYEQSGYQSNQATKLVSNQASKQTNKQGNNKNIKRLSNCPPFPLPLFRFPDPTVIAEV